MISCVCGTRRRVGVSASHVSDSDALVNCLIETLFRDFLRTGTSQATIAFVQLGVLGRTCFF
jgi:hypothetical protein